MPLLSEQHKEALRRYQYHGGDPSLLYRLVLSPLADYLVHQWTSSSIAPNMITFGGLIVSVMTTITVLVINPELDDSNPSWLCIVIGISILIYQTMDNMDGKQARRTKSSSPLGLLFDHGCDAINASLLAINMGSIFATRWTTKIFLGYFIGFVPFYYQTWEEYYTGTMILPAFNGPSEGLVVIAIFSFMSAYFGSQFWQNHSIALPSALSSILIEKKINIPENILAALDLELSMDSTIYITPFQVVVVVGVVWSFLTMIVQLRTVIIEARKRAIPVQRALSDLAPISVYFASSFTWCAVSEVALPRYPLITMLLITSIFVEMAVHVMVMHVVGGATQPWQRHLAYGTPSLLLTSITMKGSSLNHDVEAGLLFVYAFVSTAITAFKLYQICAEVSDALDIYVFVLGKKSKNK